jgi:phosphoglycolate phosphatase
MEITEKAPPFAVFDCDGTLVDTHASIIHCMTVAFNALGLVPPTPAAVRATIGLPLNDCVRILSPERGERMWERIVTAYREVFFDARRFDIVDEPLFPGIPDLLDALESRGVVLGIATGKIERALILTLERHGLLSRFATLQTADKAPAKPDPAMLVRAMAEVGAAPERTVMIGDSAYDILMGRNAGTATVGVVWGQNNADELAAAGAEFLARSAGEILQRFPARAR